jgi:hypothetical protein
VFGRIDCRQGVGHVLRRPDLCAWLPHGADRLHGKAVAEDRVVTYLVERPLFERETWGNVQPHSLALNIKFDAAMAGVRELQEFVDREEVSDAIA